MFIQLYNGLKTSIYIYITEITVHQGNFFLLACSSN